MSSRCMGVNNLLAPENCTPDPYRPSAISIRRCPEYRWDSAGQQRSLAGTAEVNHDVGRVRRFGPN
jgi:hypothetical protein